MRPVALAHPKGVAMKTAAMIALIATAIGVSTAGLTVAIHFADSYTASRQVGTEQQVPIAAAPFSAANDNPQAGHWGGPVGADSTVNTETLGCFKVDNEQQAMQEGISTGPDGRHDLEEFLIGVGFNACNTVPKGTRVNVINTYGSYSLIQKDGSTDRVWVLSGYVDHDSDG